LAEDLVKTEAEIYVACLIDKLDNTHMIMACAAGGAEIEDVARTRPEMVIQVPIHPIVGIEDYMVRFLTKSLAITDGKGFSSLLNALYSIALEMDASLVEINPLAQTHTGLIALDAKVIIDDKAAFRHKDFVQKILAEQKNFDQRPRTKSQLLAETLNLNYLPLEGDIGSIADGAGTGMLTMDMVYDAGGKPANFCEMGGLANTEIMEHTLGAVLADKRIKVLLISLIGGLTRMDEMAAGIVNYLDKNGKTVPIIVRMCGTKAEAGIPMLQRAGVETYEDLMPAVNAAVNVVRKE
jgi:succinyl-CoA synthetase beta subunit